MLPHTASLRWRTWLATVFIGAMSNDCLEPAGLERANLARHAMRSPWWQHLVEPAGFQMERLRSTVIALLIQTACQLIQGNDDARGRRGAGRRRPGAGGRARRRGGRDGRGGRRAQ